MEYKQLGNTDIKASVLSFGASPLGDEFRKTTAEERQRAVDLAIDQGINYFDTSPYYGRTLSETRLGECLKGKRDKVYIATKCGRYDSDKFDFSTGRILKSIDESLERLQTDYVDILQAHDIEFGDMNQVLEEAVPAMMKIKESGKARYIGVTGLQLKVLAKVAEVHPIDEILSYCRYNLMIDDMDEMLTPICKQKGIGLVNASPLHMRILTETGAPDWHPAPDNVKAAGVAVVKLCKERGYDPADVALRFCIDHEYAATTLVGMSRPDHVERNIKGLNAKIDPELFADIAKIVEPVKNITWQSGRPVNNDYEEHRK
jgi:L-galactose dehydrogenase